MGRCVYPLEGYRSASPNDNGRYPLSFGVHGSDLERPIQVPCGKCVGCLQDRAQDWSIRCFHEASMHTRNSFVTYTYADPAPEKLCKRDLQLMFKRQRKAGYSFRYFACGEYGSRTHRPHYHVLYFGEDFRDGSETLGYGELNGYYYNFDLTRMWGLGHVTIAKLELGSTFYTCGYSLKNQGTDDCFQLMSTRPFLGSAWLDKYYDDVVRNGFVTIDGIKYAVPRTYLERQDKAIHFEALRDRHSEYVRTMSPEKKWKLREGQRSREINFKSALANKRGENL